MYYYEIDVKDNFILTELRVDEHSVPLNEFEVEFLRKVLENKMINNLLQRLDYLRGALEAKDGIELESYYALVKALVTQSFQTDFKIAEPLYYVHVLPVYGGYLNADQEAHNKFYFDTKSEWGGSKTKFTKEEIEEFKKYPELKGINFDKCLERVEEDD